MLTEMNEKPLVFISHIEEAKELAKELADRISEVFPDDLDFFVAPRPGTIASSESFLNEIEKALSKSRAYIILCSKTSIRQPWVNFETGASRMSRILNTIRDPNTAPNIFLLTYGGLKPGMVKEGPFAGMHFMDIQNEESISYVIRELGSLIPRKVPGIFNVKTFIASLPPVIKGPEFHEFILPALREFSERAKGKLSGNEIRGVVHAIVRGASMAAFGKDKPEYSGLEPTFDSRAMYECDLCGETSGITDTGCCETCGLFCSMWFKPTEKRKG